MESEEATVFMVCTYFPSSGTQKRPCLGEGAKMVTGTEGCGP